MVTSEVPPNRLISNINCTSNCVGATFGESYYKLIDLTDERYQYSRPVTWSPDTSNTSNPRIGVVQYLVKVQVVVYLAICQQHPLEVYL